MKKLSPLTIPVLAIALLANFSSQDDSLNGGVKPAINFQGTVTDISAKKFNALNITVDRLYKQIPVYQVAPASATPTYDPSINLARLDLSEISSIKVIQNQMTQKYSSRDYLTIEVTSNDPKKTKNNYLIEADKKIICDEENAAGPIEKEIKIKALEEIVITGYEAAEHLQEVKAKKPEIDKTPESNRNRMVSFFKNKVVPIFKRS